MRIAHAVAALTKGGAEKVVVDLANEATRRGHDVHVIAGFAADPALISHRLDPAIMLEHVAPTDGDKRGAYLGLPGWLWRHRQWLDGFDVIHCHLTHAAVLGSLTSAMQRMRRRCGPAIVETFHGVGMPIRPRQRLIASGLARGRDGFALMARDAFWDNFLASHPDIPSAVIPNGIAADPPASVDAARAWRKSMGISDGKRVVGTIGRMRAERQPMLIVDTFAQIAEQDSETHFVMGGDGPLLDEVRSAIAQRGLADRVALPGLVVDPSVVLANLDLYLTMNVGPVTGLAGLEAVFAGVPSVAIQMQSDYGDGAADWIWSDKAASQVAGESLRLLASSSDRAALADRQRAYVDTHFSVGRAQDEYEALYARAIAKRSGNREGR